MGIEKMKIEELMSENIICVDMDEKLSVVRELFIEHKFHHLMVLDKNKEVVAVVSERDYFKATNANVELPSANKKDLDMLNKRVHQIISRKLVVVDQSAPFSTAIKKIS